MPSTTGHLSSPEPGASHMAAAAAAASWCCAGMKKDAIDHWASEVRDLEKQIVKARKAVEQGPATSSYFVFFHRCRETLRAGWSVCLYGCACSPKPSGGAACGSWISRAICWVGICRLSQCMHSAGSADACGMSA